MKGDFTRDTFDRFKHFSRVLTQQGRVQIDADGNEQTAILLHYLQTLAMDIIGRQAGPANFSGFELGQESDLSSAAAQRLKEKKVLPLKAGDFLIGPGRYYVDGIMCEIDEFTTYLTQPDLPGGEPLLKGHAYLTYLDVWERHVTSVEDDYIREKALGGPDTATRAKVVWQLKVTDRSPIDTELPTDFDCGDVKGLWDDWVDLWQPPNRGLLRARLEPTEKLTDPCIIAPDSRYRGAENQLYRVEIHRGGNAWTGDAESSEGTGATFKWSRDNGAVVTSLVGVEGDDLSVGSTRGFVPNGWVEVTDEARDLRGEPGTLARLIKVEGDALTLDPDSRSDNVDLSTMTKVRRWEQRAVGDVELFGGVVPVVEGQWIPLEDGIEVYFAEAPDKATGGQTTYRAGDYWLIPARVATGDIEWPTVEVKTGDGQSKQEARAMPPRGVEHHYAHIAVVYYDGAAFTFRDCRCEFMPINDCVSRVEPYVYFTSAPMYGPTRYDYLYGGRAIGPENFDDV